jgi:hypothetical protein
LLLGHVQGRAMTVQDRPTNLRIEDLPQFVTVRGGAYFFMPGIKALQALARVQTNYAASLSSIASA